MAGTESRDPRPMDGDELTVESLDGREHPPLRVRVVAGVMGARRFVRRPVWLTRRRAGFAALSLALVAAFTLSVTGLAGQWWNAGRLAVLWHFAPTYTQVALHARAPGTLAAMGAWERIPLPPTSDRMDALVVSPTDPQAALACTGPQSDPKTFETQDGPITLWRTRDGGQHWQPIALPVRTGKVCSAQMAEGAPERLLVMVHGAGGCQASHPLFSTDGGQHWRVLSPPLPPLPDKMENCSLSASVTAHHLYAAVDITVLVSITRNSNGESYNYQTTIWSTHSDDDGQTWTTPSNTMPSEATLLGSISSADGQIITLGGSYYNNGNPPVFGTRFWLSRDAGATWQPQAVLPGFFAEWLMAAPGVTLEHASTTKPVYALSGTQIPWENLRLQAAEISGRTWAPLPPLPVGGASAERTGITIALAATPNGRLLVLGLGLGTSIPEGGSFDELQKQAQGLWEWDPVAARWSAITPALPVPWPSQCGTPCWHGEISVGAGPQGSGAYVWLISSGDLSAAPTVLRVRLPAGA